VNRWNALMMLGFLDKENPLDKWGVPFFEDFDSEYSVDTFPTEFVISMNLKRRHLDVGQRAAIAAELATMRQGERTDNYKNLPQNCGMSTASAAKAMNVSTRSVETASHPQSRSGPGRGSQAGQNETGQGGQDCC